MKKGRICTKAFELFSNITIKSVFEKMHECMNALICYISVIELMHVRFRI